MTTLADLQTILSEDDLLRLGAEQPPFEVIDGELIARLLYPDEKELHLYRQAEQNTSRIFQAEETFDAAEVLPGLQFSVQTLFNLPEIE